jgi:hypothetical protein
VTEPLSDTLEANIYAISIALARRHKLEHDGTIWCWACSERRALLPSLHCHVCLMAAHRRVGRLAPLCVNREQTPEDVEACR